MEYPFGSLDELELAYALTIHKSQGSEYPAVVIPLLPGPKLLMNRNLLYTAVTRAKKCVTIVGDERTFSDMIKKASPAEKILRAAGQTFSSLPCEGYSSSVGSIRSVSEPIT